MSRDQWYAQTNSKIYSSLDSLIASHKVKLSLKTDDPRASLVDEANELFLEGVSSARDGDHNYDTAAPNIATAFLMSDGRCVIFSPQLPPGSNPRDILDYELLSKLIEHDPTTASSSVLRMLLGLRMGNVPGVGQQLLSQSMVHIDILINLIKNDPRIEAPGSRVLGGFLSRKLLLFHKSSVHMALGDFKSAMRDLSDALKIDAGFTLARESRACIWTSNSMKSDKEIYQEFRRVVSERHKDDRVMEVAYAVLTLKTMNNSSLGTVADARLFYEKMKQSSERRDEIYGQRARNEVPSLVKLAHEAMSQSRGMEVYDMLGLERVGRSSHGKTKYSCLKCGATKCADGSKLFVCTKCDAVHYCSASCQKNDWADHKHSCKLLKKEAAEEKAAAARKKSEDDAVAKKSEDEANARADQAAADLLAELDMESGAADKGKKKVKKKKKGKKK